MQGRMNTTTNYQIRLISKDKVNERGKLRKNMCRICDKLVRAMRRRD